MKNYKTLLSISMLSILTACGGSSNNSPESTMNNSPEPTINTGVFIDSAVINIGYRTETLEEAVTNSLGEYEYLEGETVTFFIGALEFPPVTASGVVTPADIAAGDGTLQTNILQILQTLDSDGIAENGISIYDTAADAFIGTEFDLSNENFDSEIAGVLDSIESGLTLIDESTANAHFEATLHSQILGSWLFSGNVLTFIDEQHYIIIHEHADESGEAGGQSEGSVEYGNYNWNVSNGAFSVTLIGESDGWGGLYDGGSNVTSAVVQNDSLTLHVLDGDGVDVTFTRVTSDTNSLIGGWILEDNILVFLSESEYVIAHWDNLGSYAGNQPQALSGEYGVYSLDGNTFTVSSASIDTDGDGGLYNAEDSSDQEGETLTIGSSEITFTDQNEGSFSFERIGTF